MQHTTRLLHLVFTKAVFHLFRLKVYTPIMQAERDILGQFMCHLPVQVQQ